MSKTMRAAAFLVDRGRERYIIGLRSETTEKS